jgi:hypothetical protein
VYLAKARGPWIEGEDLAILVRQPRIASADVFGEQANPIRRESPVLRPTA